MQLKIRRQRAEDRRQMLRLTVLSLCFLQLAFVAKAEDRFNIKYQHYEDDKSIYYKNTGGVKSDRWLVSLAKTITEKTSLALNYGVDAISSASWKVDGVTSASKRAGEETRYSGGFGVNHTEGTANYSVNFGVSRENNYNSNYFSASAARDFNKRNTTLAISLAKAWDEIYSTRIGDTRSYPQTKDTSTIGISVAQTLTPWTVAAIGYEYTQADGYQAHPENLVQLSDGSFADEVHPESRSKNAAVLRVNQYLPWSAAVHADYRYYHDSWGVGSNTVGLKYYQYIFKDLILRAGYRYYTQGAAEFYSAAPTSSDKYPTIDGKLRRFDSEMYGVKLIYNISKLTGKMGLKAAEKVNLDLKYDRYQQVDAVTSATSRSGEGLKADIVQVGLGMEF